MLESLTQQLRQSTALSSEQIAGAVSALVDERGSVESKADFLTALARKGETTDEIAAFARELRDKSIRPPSTGESVDVCGTGGDHLKTFNISTTVAFIVAAAGIPEFANGGLLSKAGIPLPNPPRRLKKLCPSSTLGPNWVASFPAF